MKIRTIKHIHYINICNAVMLVSIHSIPNIKDDLSDNVVLFLYYWKMTNKHFIFSINLFPFCSFTWTNIIIVRRNKGTNIWLSIITLLLFVDHTSWISIVCKKNLYSILISTVCATKSYIKFNQKSVMIIFCDNHGIDRFYQDNVPMVTSQ